jgi:hypothetical protein
MFERAESMGAGRHDRSGVDGHDSVHERRDRFPERRDPAALAQRDGAATERQDAASLARPDPAVAERHDSAPAAPTVERHDAAPVARHDTAVSERRDPIAEAWRDPPTGSVAASRPAPRQDDENTKSVLARLRQVSPAVTPGGDFQAAPDRPRRGPSPSLRRLIEARAALAGGQIEDARRLLQQAQLQLVFRPVGSDDDDPAASGRAAADVARALDALSANDTKQSRTYIDRALNDTSARATEIPERDTASRGGGYAPAYPVR